LRGLFFAAEAGAIVGTVSFLWFSELTRHGSNAGYALRIFVFAIYVALFIVSFPLRRYDRSLSDIGFLTCFLVFIIGAIFPRF
jgi:hypothetical protein